MNKIKMYTYFSETHREMLDQFFLPSVPESFEVVVNRFDQRCSSGEYLSCGWVKAMAKKVEIIRGAIDSVRQSDGPDFFVYSDCDIRFFSDLSENITSMMSSYDYIAMDDEIYCHGFMAIRADDRAAFMWEWVAENIEKYQCDQPTGNAFIKEHERATKLNRWIPSVIQNQQTRRHMRVGPIRFGMFPRIQYFNYMHLGTNDPLWDGKRPINLSGEQLDKMMMMHANFTVGVENKLRMLEDIGQQKIYNDQAKHLVSTP